MTLQQSSKQGNPQSIPLAGPLDQYGAELLKATALALLETPGDVIFQFGEIDRIHAACLQVFLALKRDLEPLGREVILLDVDQGVRKLFRISGTDHLFQFASST